MSTKKTAENHALTGTARPDRQKRLGADARGIGAPPAHLADTTAAIWHELAKALPAGVGGPSDRATFELLCRAFERTRAGSPTAAELAQVRMLLDSFGLSPAGRVRLDLAAADAGRHGIGFDF